MARASSRSPRFETASINSITLDDAKPLFLEFQAAGVEFHQGLKTEPWGARTFIVGSHIGWA